MDQDYSLFCGTYYVKGSHYSVKAAMPEPFCMQVAQLKVKDRGMDDPVMVLGKIKMGLKDCFSL